MSALVGQIEIAVRLTAAAPSRCSAGAATEFPGQEDKRAGRSRRWLVRKRVAEQLVWHALSAECGEDLGAQSRRVFPDRAAAGRQPDNAVAGEPANDLLLGRSLPAGERGQQRKRLVRVFDDAQYQGHRGDREERSVRFAHADPQSICD